jgi:mRNA-degrading endonuclease toxin of MazEF toxin-antitoxin module
VEMETPFLSQKSYLKTEDIRSVSTKRLIKKIGRVEDKIMRMVEDRIKLLLSLT